MANLIIRPEWYISEKGVTPENVFNSRREFLKKLGFAGAGLMAASGGLLAAEGQGGAASGKYPYPRNTVFNPGWPLSDEKVAATYNNYYEFSTSKDRVHQLVDKFTIDPWSIEIGGMVEKPMKVDARELAGMFPLEERVYRFRCVEAWAMVVPWTGFPLSKLLEKVQPKSGAKFVKFQTAVKADQMPGLARLRGYPWPYTEGLRLDEAMNPLTLVTTGIYGKPMPKQHGAPVRMVVPWKYGYKSIKSIVKIELVDRQPATLWETLSPEEYPFESNVDPAVPHPRWSQATERMIDSGDRVRTQPYNGYGSFVAGLYKKA
ncbi:MAG TPA: protein-methionine-sulfoxide reductase catalytic subunit MsrP [Roseimicrobium sp.]|nr:protein-methionine-sulfoxide reductase catalytic subunit MsrP [Roseimicrobium sp.]